MKRIGYVSSGVVLGRWCADATVARTDTVSRPPHQGPHRDRDRYRHDPGGSR